MHTQTMKLYWGAECDVTPKAGRLILVDGWGSPVSRILQDCEIPEFAPFRLPSLNHPDVAYAVRVEVTGRTIQTRPWNDYGWVKIRIVFVGDGEPDTCTSGWMKV